MEKINSLCRTVVNSGWDSMPENQSKGMNFSIEKDNPPPPPPPTPK
jgi:hypothetical protein